MVLVRSPPRRFGDLTTTGRPAAGITADRGHSAPVDGAHQVHPALTPEAAIEGSLIDAVLEDRAIRTVFQPVVHLATHSVAGFEALSRGPAGSPLESPLALLDAAGRAGRLGEVDWLCRTSAMRIAAEADLPETLSWLINVEPAGLTMDCPAELQPILARARAKLRVILEVVERDLQGNVLELIQATDQARRDSWGVALDDVGAEETSLALLPFLSPDVVKLDMSLVNRLPDAAAAAVTAGVRSYAERTGSVILAEGIENEEQEQLALMFGATYGQGYYYGRPGPLPTSVPAPRHPIPLRQHLPPLDGLTPFEILARTVEPQQGIKKHLVHISAHLESEAAQGSRASVLLAGFQDKAYFSAAKQARYRELSAVNALTIVLGRDLARHDEATYHLGPLPPGSRLAEEWVVIVLNLHYAAAFVARDCGDSGPDAERRFDFIYTHDRPAVINAARRFIQDLATGPLALSTPAGPGDPVAASRDTYATERTALVPAAAPEETSAFRAAAARVLDYLNTSMPMALWTITRVENDRQTFLYLDENDCGVTVGGSHPWKDSYCVHMVAGTAPPIAPDAAAVPIYAAAPANRMMQIGAYAGAPIVESDSSLFGVICGLDHNPRQDLAHFGPTLGVLSDLLAVTLAGDRALSEARLASRTALTRATTDAVTGLRNRRAWDSRIAELDRDFATYADPTVIVAIDVDAPQHADTGPPDNRPADQLRSSAAEIMRRHVHGHDFLAHLGGNEFGIIFTNCPESRAATVVEQLTRAFERGVVPASVGWAALHPGTTVRHTLDVANRVMSHVKNESQLARALAG